MNEYQQRRAAAVGGKEIEPFAAGLAISDVEQGGIGAAGMRGFLDPAGEDIGMVGYRCAGVVLTAVVFAWILHRDVVGCEEFDAVSVAAGSPCHQA